MESKTPEQKAKVFIQYLETFYGKAAKEWEGQYGDDRQLFCNILKQFIEAYSELARAGIESPTVWHSLNVHRTKEEELLKGILKRFKPEEVY